MPSQFFGLNIAYKGLLASNAALNTTSNNISNVHTEGYSRQQVKQQAADALRVFEKYGCAGAGVDTLAIERIHDDFYDNKYWNNNSLKGEYDDKAYYMKQIENYFADTDATPGFTTIFKNMATALQEVMKNAGSTTTKAQYVSTMSSLTEYFNNMYGNMQKLQKDVNSEIKLKIDEIDSIAAEIASLNKQINILEMAEGGNANELRDRRGLLVDQLSNIVDVTTEEMPIKDPNHPDLDTGATRYLIYIAGGQLLVDSSEYNSLTCKAKEIYEKENQSDITGLYDVYWENGQKFDLHNAAMGGALKGLVAMRDGNNSENFRGKVTEVGKVDVNGESFDCVKVSIDKDYLKDLNKCNLSDTGGIIRLGNNLYYYDHWAVEKSATGEYEYTFVISDNTKNKTALTNDRLGMDASIGSAIDYQGIPYYMSQMTEWVRTYAQHVNDILNKGYDKYGNEGYNFLVADIPTENAQYDFGQIGHDGTQNLGMRFDLDSAATFRTWDAVYNQTTKVSNVTSYYWMTAGNCNVNQTFLNDPDFIASRNNVSNGVDDYSTLEELYGMFSDKSKMSFRGCSASEYLECVLSDVALNASRANTFSQSYTDIGTAIDNQRTSISGVDEDDEAVNLVKYQNAYNLASKMIQTLTEVYDRLILYTGV